MSVKIPSDLLIKERRLAVTLYQRELLRYILSSPRNVYVLDNLVEMLGGQSKGWRVDNLESVCVRLFQEKRQAEHERELLFRFCIFFSRLERYPFYYQLIRDQPLEDLIRVDYYGSDINEFK